VTDDPIVRLKAGLDADEQLAKDATQGGWQSTETADGEPDRAVVCIDHPTVPDAATVLFEADYGTLADATHIARQDPAHAIRIVAAHREILAKYEAADRCCKVSGGAPGPVVTRDALKQAVLAIAAVYGDDPG
jgi:hypothetical protein